MRYVKMNRMQKKLDHEQRVKDALQGSGLYVYENNVKGDYKLPKPTASGKAVLRPKEQFQGDSYYMSLVRIGDLKYIREIVSAEKKEEVMPEQKLILDQPDRVTVKGTVEQVIAPEKPQKLIEQKQGKKKKDPTLLTEDPIDGIEILNG